MSRQLRLIGCGDTSSQGNNGDSVHYRTFSQQLDHKRGIRRFAEGSGIEMMETVQSTYQPQLHQVTSGFYMDIATDLNKFLAVKFPCSGVPFFVNWCTSFRKLLEDMLKETPASRVPKASEVWERLKEMVEVLGTKRHCELERYYNYK